MGMTLASIISTPQTKEGNFLSSQKSKRTAYPTKFNYLERASPKQQKQSSRTHDGSTKMKFQYKKDEYFQQKNLETKNSQRDMKSELESGVQS